MLEPCILLVVQGLCPSVLFQASHTQLLYIFRATFPVLSFLPSLSWRTSQQDLLGQLSVTLSPNAAVATSAAVVAALCSLVARCLSIDICLRVPAFRQGCVISVLSPLT